ncbi:response regulator transcription factor [Cupriavidus plantarum]|uniref:response regulator transcription factor n=1 Tax=Cupriavidus plantarum TaxID=942865 RepID=UPI000E238A4C|nr:response regulator transcription factor [Cupriavidus plantarum]NYH97930.1 two-component system response regulator EvgA [Cupriavidus plantarum]REE92093.1 LuxR family two component transcriptional regulator [Cupriavidus plantarum]RLK35639.1 LuxR family two component transcriptional regulator [Cupriavidus plantarum]CAG2127366.1 Putative transcriptional regulator [Cupriavidus plantarum]SMR67455.1 two component transcriptional regulator, LuxR family [Cupriavidus plantarum]
MPVALIVDDHPAVRVAVASHLSAHLGYQTHEAATAADAMQSLKEVAPDVVIVDLDLPSLPGEVVIEAVEEKYPAARRVVLSAVNSAAQRALHAGAHGHVAKGSGLDQLGQVLQAVMAGYVVFPAELLASLHRMASGSSDPMAGLSRREMTVLRFLAAGHSNKAIADTLHISNKTVSSHKTSIMTKLGLKSMIDLAEFARKHRLTGTE